MKGRIETDGISGEVEGRGHGGAGGPCVSCKGRGEGWLRKAAGGHGVPGKTGHMS